MGEFLGRRVTGEVKKVHVCLGSWACCPVATGTNTGVCLALNSCFCHPSSPGMNSSSPVFQPTFYIPLLLTSVPRVGSAGPNMLKDASVVL